MRSSSRVLRRLVALACALGFASAVSAKDETVLRVGAAASLREVAEKMGARFGELVPGTRVEPSFGASSELAAQLRAGAPMDVLMSADEEIPRALEKEGLGNDLHPFAGNRLVVVASAEVAGRVKQPPTSPATP